MNTLNHSSIVSARGSKLIESFGDANIDAVIITSPTNRLYYSGFTGSNGVLLISVHGTFLVTDSRYTEQARNECPWIEIVEQKKEGSLISSLAKKLEIGKIGFEEESMSYSQYLRITRELGGLCELVTCQDQINVLRSVKDQNEIKLIEKAISISDIGMAKAIDVIAPGVTEKDVALALEIEMRSFGADGIAFDAIVATGLNSSQPHHRAGDTEIAVGDSVVVDIGAVYCGYRSDVSRTVYVGSEPSNQFKSRYNVVRIAQMEAISLLKTGMTGHEVDLIARNLINSSEFEGSFCHGLGHGVGLDIHEKPMIVPGSKDVLSENMIFTVEPGVYFPDWGGIRLEDVVILEKSGARVLTQASKHMEKLI